uniref:Uncharacterized protein n=1 Tax=Arundo donax TaxID=35708 RepID=A0A0A9HKF6_ARUDO
MEEAKSGGKTPSVVTDVYGEDYLASLFSRINQLHSQSLVFTRFFPS